MAEQAVIDEQAEFKKRAMRRLIVAGVLVVAAIVALTVLNHKPEERPAPVTVPETLTVAIPEPALPEAMPEEITKEEPVPEAPPVPDSEATPAMPPPPPPQVLNKSSQPAPAAAKSRPEAPATAYATKPAQPSTSRSPAPEQAPASFPPEKLPESAPQTQRTVAETAPPKAYTVQLGLFSNPENALQLQKRLAEHGIKSYTETRLNVGPFQNKAEADQAMTRIRSMGINAVLVPAR